MPSHVISTLSPTYTFFSFKKLYFVSYLLSYKDPNQIADHFLALLLKKSSSVGFSFYMPGLNLLSCHGGLWGVVRCDFSFLCTAILIYLLYLSQVVTFWLLFCQIFYFLLHNVLIGCLQSSSSTFVMLFFSNLIF